MDYTLADTIYLMFTTRAFASGAPTQLAGTPVVSAYENDSATQITAGITLGVDHDTVTGLNLLTIVATGANGYEAGKDYNMVITTGTVGGVSVVGEVVGTFSLQRSAAAVDLANGTDGLGAIKTDTAAILVDTADMQPKLGSPAADVSADIAAVKVDTAAILIDTTEIGAAGAGLTEAGGDGDHLTAINLPNQTMDITGSLSGSVGSVTGNVGGDVQGNVDGSVASVTAGVTLDATATSAQLVDDIWDESLTGATHDTPTSAGRRIRQLGDIVSGAVVDVSATTTSFDTNITGYADNFFNDQVMRFVDGNLDNQVKVILSYTGSSGTFVFDEAWTEAPANDDGFDIISEHSHPLSQITEGVRSEMDSNSTQLTAIVGDTNELQTNQGAWATATTVDLNADQSAVTIGTVTTNTDMRGTDSAATAANLATAQTDLDTLTGADGATLATSQPNYAPSTHSAADVWSVATRVLTANTNLNDVTVANILTTQMTESYAANGVAPTLAEAIFAIHQKLMQTGYTSTSSTTYQLDNATTAFVGTLDDATNPTEDRRA